MDLAGDNSDERLDARMGAFRDSNEGPLSSTESFKLEGPADVWEDGPDTPEGVLLILGVVDVVSEPASIIFWEFIVSVLGEESSAALPQKIS